MTVISIAFSTLPLASGFPAIVTRASEPEAVVIVGVLITSVLPVVFGCETTVRTRTEGLGATGGVCAERKGVIAVRAARKIGRRAMGKVYEVIHQKRVKVSIQPKWLTETRLNF
ncbi:MAG: hypothetical protein EBU04_07130 [Verrucomicrobia bacterium]|nr:hypothetical protein [Verrucomicrobiota bacterium]